MSRCTIDIQVYYRCPGVLLISRCTTDVQVYYWYSDVPLMSRCTIISRCIIDIKVYHLYSVVSLLSGVLFTFEQARDVVTTNSSPSSNWSSSLEWFHRTQSSGGRSAARPDWWTRTLTAIATRRGWCPSSSSSSRSSGGRWSSTTSGRSLRFSRRCFSSVRLLHQSRRRVQLHRLYGSSTLASAAGGRRRTEGRRRKDSRNPRNCGVIDDKTGFSTPGVVDIVYV